MEISLTNPAFPFRKQLLMNIMRIMVFFFCTAFFALSPNDIVSQNSKVKIAEDKLLTVNEVFYLIMEQTDYKFFYEKGIFEDFPKVQVKKGVIRTNELLKRSLSHGNLEITLNANNAIIIKEIPPKTLEEKVQEYNVSGTVKDQSGQPLSGANVIEKGTINGTQTDFDGNFTIKLTDKNAILIISYIGFVTKEIAIEGQSQLDISLKESAEGLDEVVLVGYGTSTKKDVTGSVVSIDFEDANLTANTSILQAMQGKAPGINIGAVSAAGEEPRLSIRGQNSLSGSNNPLLVVDGIIYSGSLLDFSAVDIKSVDFLKDASAAAVYGSRAANGVVLITTKSGTGEIGKPSITFNTYGGIQQAGHLLDIMDGDQYVQKILDFREATGQEADPTKVADYLEPNEVDNYLNGREVDWYDILLRTATIQNYELGISGRTERTKYYMSGTLTKQDGIIIGDDFKRSTLRANFSTDVTEWLTIGLNSSYSNRDYSGDAADFGTSILSSPYGTIYQVDNPSQYENFPQTDQLIANPLLPLLNDNLDIQDNLFTVLDVDIKLPVKGLTFKHSYSKNLTWNRQASFNRDRRAQEVNGLATKSNEFRNSWLMNNILNYENNFNNIHKVGATLVYTRDSQDSETSNIRATNFGTKILGYNAVQLGGTQTVSSGFTEQASEGFMARVNYGYDNKYLITNTFRRDGFSGFAANHKYANFFSSSLAWVLSEENFMKSADWISFLKLRLSYGQNGNQGLGAYSSLARVGATQYVFGDGGNTENGYEITTIANNDLKWETTKSLNLGFNFELFDGRLSGDLDFYNSKTVDLLVQRSLPSYTGYTTKWTNIGEVQNKGVEILLSSVNVDSGDFKWETEVSFSLNRNKIVSLYGEDADGDGQEDDDISEGWFIGESLGSIYNYKLDGVYQVGDELPRRYREGDFRLLDTDGVDGITPDDRVIYGNENPNYRFGITNSLSYKQFTLSFFINSIQGGNNWYLRNNGVLNPNYYFPGRANMVNIPYWTPTNPTNEFPRIDYRPRINHRYDQDRSFVRLQDVTIAYDFSSTNFIQQWGLSKLRVYASGKNLATWTNWTGYDPELGSSLGSTPIISTVILGLEIGL
ncbi:SusC/RagA family TonB-linked outer membrane protein [Confluentibacter flavum]|uniref:SusC/RagA family TonB-linked outer membrane protein n=1 Tax=Confluentibacter flavum TaxID=1909700 RepID=A0A2N3HGS7_9FLAO|nr:TonB-dependent receptor [Confluentibacter flavum]PKQ44167.1 SusC/RagA family TonB-linked outer membrane protein [Confluentibacter flavum]